MRRLLCLTLAVTALTAGLLSGCGKPQSAASDGAPSASPAAAPGEAERKALQAALPAPYNTADLDNGQGKFALCASCHTVTAGGPNMTGPNLHGIFGSKAGAVDKFAFSDAMKASGITWDAAQMDRWITDPKAVLPGTKMTFPGFKDPKDRTDLIAYLMVESGYQP